jgi:hypothetical protein
MDINMGLTTNAMKAKHMMVRNAILMKSSMVVLLLVWVKRHAFRHIFDLPVSLRQGLAEKRRLFAPQLGLVQ